MCRNLDTAVFSFFASLRNRGFEEGENVKKCVLPLCARTARALAHSFVSRPDLRAYRDGGT